MDMIDKTAGENAEQQDPKVKELENAEWVESLDYVLATAGPERVIELMERLQHHAQSQGVTFPFTANGKAMGLGDAVGCVKVVADAEHNEIIGAHMIGADVTEMIQGYVIGRTLETTEAELIETIFPHPTISESMHEAVLAAYGRAIHI